MLKYCSPPCALTSNEPPSEDIHYLIFTARKRSLGQGNVFTSGCHSVHGGGGGDPAPGTTRYGERAGGMHPTGMHPCIINIFPLLPVFICYFFPKGLRKNF